MTPFRTFVVKLARRMEAWAVQAPTMTDFDNFKQLELTAEIRRRQDHKERQELRTEMRGFRTKVGMIDKLDARLKKLEAK